MNQKPTVIIVSDYSTGVTLAPGFNKNGCHCIHVILKRMHNLHIINNNSSDYIYQIIIENEDNPEYYANEIKKQGHNIVGVIAGSDSGVIFADTLSCYFDVPRNIPALTLARRNKFYMIDALKQKGFNTQAQIKTNSLNDIICWYQAQNFKRIVLKPLMSGASDNVYYCNSENEIETAFNTILGAKTVYNEINKEVLAQEYIDGKEYIVNAFSMNGKHKIIDIWVGINNTPNLVSNDLYADLVPQNQHDHKILSAYTQKILSALGIQNGPSHSEIRINNNGEPFLIECGARLAGKIWPAALEKIYEESQYSLLLKMYTKPQAVMKFFKENLTPRKVARYVYFKSDIEGLIKQEINLDEFYEIPSLAYVNFLIKKGNNLQKTCKTKKIGRPGFTYLIAENDEQIKRDYLALIKLEEKTYKKIIGELDE